MNVGGHPSIQEEVETMNASRAGGSGKFRKAIHIATMILAGVILASCGVIPIPAPNPEPTIVPTPPDSGDVTIAILNDELKDFENIIVRVLDTDMVDTKRDDGILLLRACGDGQSISAWASGYYIATVPCQAGQTNYSISLAKYHVNDNPSYSWVEARNIGQPRSCEPCHIGADPERMEYTEWQLDGHSTVFKDYYFWTTYLGMDVARKASPPTQWNITDNSRHTRIKPDLSLPYYGPGFKTDYPADNGSCAFCHAPASVLGPQTEVDLTQYINASYSGQYSAATEGVNCDVCHKVLNVRLDANNRPFPDKPGILSFDFVREEANVNRLYAGPLPGTHTDGTEIRVTCSPVFSQSQFCAPCHYGQFWGTQIYNSYGEWLESPYANPGDENSYKTCQACHLVVNNGTAEGDTNVKTSARDACSQNNVAYDDYNHNMMQRGGDNTSKMIQGAAEIKMEANKVDGNIELSVRVNNTRAGHKFPTDSPMRHLILLVEVRDPRGTVIPQISGPTIPAWGGVGNQPGDYAGLPGQIYANILMDMDTNQSPTIAYWNPTRPAWPGSDTRLEPHKPVTSKYTFAMPANGSAVITVKLIYRYAFIEIARQKGWGVNDIIVAEKSAEMH
jgi:hypothetical protein